MTEEWYDVSSGKNVHNNRENDLPKVLLLPNQDRFKGDLLREREMDKRIQVVRLVHILLWTALRDVM